MSRLPRRTFVQGSMTAVVLVAGITATAVGTTAGGAAATPALASPHPATAIREAAPAQLQHPAHEAWSRLLAALRPGSVTTHPASPISRGALSHQFRLPGKVRGVLDIDGYRRGVMRANRSSEHGVIEQLWQFRRPAGAKAWFLTYAEANRPHPGSSFAAMHLVGNHGDLAFTATGIDSAGYHYGVGLALDGDMIVHVRVFADHRVSRADLARELRRAERPVARGITIRGLGPVTDQTTVTGAIDA